MKVTRSRAAHTLALCGGAMLAATMGGLAQQAPAAAAAQGGRGGGRGAAAIAPALFSVLDTNKDGAISRDEFRSTFDKWYSESDTAGAGSVTAAQLAATVASEVPTPAPPAAQGDPCGGRSNNPQVPCPADVEKMKAALPAKAIAKTAKPHNILVLARAAGFVHSSIPLAAATVDEMGKKLGTWTTTVTYNAADINAQNLKQYDVLFLDNTTGCFLDDPNDKAATDARRAALLDFVRSGKGLAAIHAASDSYHGSSCGPAGPPAGAAPGGFGGRGGGVTAMLSGGIFADADKNNDQKVTRAELNAVADAWFDKIDPQKTGSVSQADFTTRLPGALPAPVPGPGRANASANGAPQAPGGQPLWPEWNKIIGGYFKFHWNDPQVITYKIDDPKSPLTQMLKPGFVVHDETYTFNQESFSRTNVHVLTSVDYDKMTPEDKAKEPTQRTDHDYALSWIRPEGKGRLFYMAHGHHERNYAVPELLQHLLAGIQYAAGDLKADDSPSVKAAGGTTSGR
jgi:hypothetical protein